MLGLTFSSKLYCSSYIISIAKTASMKVGALIHFMKFLSHEVALYLYKSTIQPCMEYCCHVWAGAPKCYLELLDKLQKRICRIFGPSLGVSLEPLAHRRNVASLSLYALNAVSARFLLVCFVRLKESTFEVRKNVFYFTLKALFVLEIIRF